MNHCPHCFKSLSVKAQETRICQSVGCGKHIDHKPVRRVQAISTPKQLSLRFTV